MAPRDWIGYSSKIAETLTHRKMMSPETGDDPKPGPIDLLVRCLLECQYEGSFVCLKTRCSRENGTHDNSRGRPQARAFPSGPVELD